MKKYEAQAVSLFSRLVRLKESDERGICKCFITGEERSWNEMVAGHWIKSRFEKHRFSTMNVHAITPEANTQDETDPHLYKQKMIDKYGRYFCDTMQATKREFIKRSENDYKEMCEEFKGEIKQLLLEKI